MYKQIENPESAHWHSPLLHDISFIKKHLRYPVNKKTIWPIIWIIFSSLSIFFVAAIIFITNSRRYQKLELSIHSLMPFFVVGLVLFVVGITIYRRLQSFRFISLKSNFIVSDNIKLIGQFLLKQNIAFYHNPDAAEVFQISSTILNKESGQREIMVVIADDNRILINSHFTVQTGDRGLQQYSTGAHKKMAKDLMKWLKDNDKNYTHQFNLKITGS